MDSIWLFPISLGIILSMIVIGIVFWDDFHQEKEIDVMDIANICRPSPDNYSICGESVVNEDGSKSDYAYLLLANGQRITSGCLSDEYPRGQNSTHYSCSDGILKKLTLQNKDEVMRK